MAAMSLLVCNTCVREVTAQIHELMIPKKQDHITANHASLIL
jgi:energy-coupling factor transporter transmembrane protein EcfT